MVSSIPPNPSVSIKMISILVLVGDNTVFFQSHRPLVQGLIVGPTWNPPFFWLSNTRLTKNDLPVLYFPTIEMIPNYRSYERLERNYYAYWLKENPFP